MIFDGCSSLFGGGRFNATTRAADRHRVLLAALLARVRGELFEAHDVEGGVRALQVLEMVMRAM